MIVRGELSLRCDACQARHTVYVSHGSTVAAALDREGWRCWDGRHYCPACAEARRYPATVPVSRGPA